MNDWFNNWYPWTVGTTSFNTATDTGSNQLWLFNQITTVTYAPSPELVQMQQDHAEAVRRAHEAEVERRQHALNVAELLRRRVRDEAETRAKALLMEHLNERQKEQFSIDHSFDVKGGITGSRYRIYEKDRVWCPSRRRWYCIVAVRYDEHGYGCDIPESDVMLAKKLMIEHAEDYFMDTAIGTWGILRHRRIRW